MQDDVVLARRAAMGDGSAFAEIYRRCAPRIRRQLARMLHDPGEMEDVMQDALLRIYRGLDRFQGHSDLCTWTNRVAINTCLKHRHRARRRHDRETGLADALPAPAQDEPEAVALRHEVLARVARALAGLPDLQRRAVLLGPLRDRDTRATAALLGVAPGVVKRQLHRARVALRRAAA